MDEEVAMASKAPKSPMGSPLTVAAPCFPWACCPHRAMIVLKHLLL